MLKCCGTTFDETAIYSTWELGAEEAKKLNTYYTKYEAYVKPKSNRVFARYKFHQKVQQEGESFEQFLTDSKLLVKDCGYGDPNEMVRDRCHAILPKPEKNSFRKVPTLP